jgi:hypothetical protein
MPGLRPTPDNDEGDTAVTEAFSHPIEIVRQHHSIHRTIREILAELDWLRQHPERVGQTWDMPVILGSLRDAAVAHFAFEEDGGPFEVALRDPREAEEARELIGEHRSIEDRLSRLLAEMDGVRMPEPSVQECFDAEIRSVIDGILEHEVQERALFARVCTPR